MSMALERAPHIPILRSPFVKKNNLQGSTPKGWVLFIVIRILKQTKNEIKNHSKTWWNLLNIQTVGMASRISCKCSLRASSWWKSPISIKSSRLEFKGASLDILRSQNGEQNQSLQALMADRLFTFNREPNIYLTVTMSLSDICFCPKSTDTSIMLGKRLELLLFWRNEY